MFQAGGEKCEGGLTFGTEIGMSFKLRDVNNSKFGSANKLCGVIPMLLPFGHYKQPKLLQDPERLMNFSRSKLAEFSSAFPNDLDDDILKKIVECVRCAGQMCPGQEMDDPKCEILVAMTIVSMAMDDIYDGLIAQERLDYSNAKNFVTSISEIFSGVYKSASEIPRLLPALDEISHYYFKVIELSNKLIPGYQEKSKWYRMDMENAARGSIIVPCTQGEGKLDFSPNGRVFFGGVQNGTTQITELLALSKNIEIKEEIRHDVVFQKLKADVGIVGCALNEVYGIVRDIEREQTRDTYILINVADNQVTLQEAFNTSLKLVTDAMNDAKICIKLLKQYYSDDQQLLNYITTVEEAVDGQIYWYASCTRYGETNSKIVPLQ